MLSRRGRGAAWWVVAALGLAACTPREDDGRDARQKKLLQQKQAEIDALESALAKQKADADVPKPPARLVDPGASASAQGSARPPGRCMCQPADPLCDCL